MKNLNLLTFVLIPLFLGMTNFNASVEDVITSNEVVVNDVEIDVDACKKVVYYYKRSNDGKYRICTDRDGFRVRTPSGSYHSFGTGYSVSGLAKRYKLGTHYNKKTFKKNCDCD